MIPLRVFVSETHNPWFNLATEEWIFREMEPDAQTLFLWRNAETVVIGRNQNPWSECNLAQMEADGVRLARRTTGGGAVFHDLGNTCFTFLSPKDGYSRAVNLEIVTRALARFGIAARASGRNDLIVDTPDGERKVSGSAFRETRDRSFHHGTLLIDADLSRLAKYLTPHAKKMESKGRTSVRSRVMNLVELAPGLEHEALSQALIEEFFAQYGSRANVEVLNPDHLETRGALQETFTKLSSWDWRFGHAPKFQVQLTHYLSWGFIEIHIDSDEGRVTRARVFSDALYPELVERFESALIGQTYSKSGVSAAVATTRIDFEDKKTELEELELWMKSEVEIS